MKIVNFVLGLGAAIILSALIALGIAAFYAAPIAPNVPYPTEPYTTPCASNNVKCIAQSASSTADYNAQMDRYQATQDAYNASMKVYDRDLFIIANVIGVIVFVAGFFIVLNAGLAGQGVPVGIMVAGLWSIIYGYERGWGSIDDRLKFAIGLVVAVIVIGGSTWLMQRHARKLLRR